MSHKTRARAGRETGSIIQLSTASIEEFYELAVRRRTLLACGEDVIDAVICIFERARVSVDGHVYVDPYVFAQLSCGSRGACFAYPDEVDIAHSELLIGRTVWDVFEDTPDYIKIALLDAIYNVFNSKNLGVRPNVRNYLNGTAAAKSAQRADIITSLLSIQPGMRLCMVGVIEDIVRSAVDLGAEVSLFDFLLEGETFMDIHIGRDATLSLESSDCVLITGNAIKTRTMDDILRRSSSRGARTVVYAMSGANFAPHYLSLGAEAVTCESFPYYWYSGLESVIDVYRRS